MSPIFGLRSKLSGSDHADKDPHHWRLPAPSSYTAPKPREGKKDKPPKQTLVPDPKVFKNAFIPQIPNLRPEHTAIANASKSANPPVYPDVSHVAVHLAILECFNDLRKSADVLDVEALKAHTKASHYASQPPTYSEKPAAQSSGATTSPAASATLLPYSETGDDDRQDEEPQLDADAQLNTQKWHLLIRLAVDRFGVWWHNIGKVLQHAEVYNPPRLLNAALQLGENYIPPLDVLLVWYVFILHGDGEAYASACRDHRDIPKVQHLCFPWEALRTVIDTNAQGQSALDSTQQPQASPASSPSTLPVAESSAPSSFSGFSFSLPRAAQILFFNLSQQDPDVTSYLTKPPPYVQNHSLSIFEGIDLYEEVKKLFSVKEDHGSASSVTTGFVDEAHDLLWIRSPSLTGTLKRHTDDYFKSLLNRDLDSLLTPSDPATSDDLASAKRPPFGIELLWRTHRLFPVLYRLFNESQRGQTTSGLQLASAIDSPLLGGFDGGIVDPEEGVSRARANTLDSEMDPGPSVLERDPICLCWTCERIRDDEPEYAYYLNCSRSSSCPISLVASSTSNASSSSTSVSSADESPAARNAVTPGSPPATDKSCYNPIHIQGLNHVQIKKIRHDVAFHRAVESKRRAQEPLPVRNRTAAEKDAEKKKKKKKLATRSSWVY